MSPEDLTRMRHMLESAREAMALIKDKSRQDLEAERILSLALVRLLEIVGEAANRVSHTSRLKFSDIPWAQIISLRNRLIHGYDAVDMDVLWEILTDDLPPLLPNSKRLNILNFIEKTAASILSDHWPLATGN